MPSIMARDARRKAKARPEVQFAIVAQRALSKAHRAATDAALKQALGTAYETVTTVLSATMPTTAAPTPVEPVVRKRRGRTAETVNG